MSSSGCSTSSKSNAPPRGGRVFDILGEAFYNVSLKDLLIEAIRHGERPEVKARLDQVIEGALDTAHLREIMRRNALVEQHMRLEDLYAVKEEMDNEILYGLNQADKFLLAIVLVDGDDFEGPYYLREPFQQEPDFGVGSSDYSLAELLSKATVPTGIGLHA